MKIPFDNTFARLPERFYSRQKPARVPKPELIRVNEPLAVQLGLDPEELRSLEGLDVFSGNGVAEGSEPLAQAYAGHQFGRFVPQLGDGRAILLGEIVGRDGCRRDLQLKGAGRTAFSRGGDGKAALGPVLREYVVSEAMYAMGVPTTRALAAVRTGEYIQRDSLLDGAVFTRVAASHLRVGTFQYFAARGDFEAVRILMDHAIARHYPGASGAVNPALAFLDSVISAQAFLISKWLGLGFIHGVMNTDNCAISGETIDYGPCAFMDVFHAKRVFSSIDGQGRYAWGNQPAIALWNLTRLAETLVPLLAETESEGIRLAEEALDRFEPQFTQRYHEVFAAKLGLPCQADPVEEPVRQFVAETLSLLSTHQVDYTIFFREWTRAVSGDGMNRVESLFESRGAFVEWQARWREFSGGSPRIAAMRSNNPVVIPRNHQIEHAIQEAYRGQFGRFHRLVDGLHFPYEEDPSRVDLEVPPREDEIVGQTFCGT